MNDTNRYGAREGPVNSSFGNKFRGVAQVIHGTGENIRGTLLGAADTACSGRLETENDEIARLGRLEVERGLANLRGTDRLARTSAPPGGWPDSHAVEDRTIGPAPYDRNAGFEALKNDPGQKQPKYRHGDAVVDPHPESKPFYNQEQNQG